MGKIEEQNLHQRPSNDVENPGSSGLLCEGCSMVLRGLSEQFNFKCLFVLLLSLSVILPGIFWVIPKYAIKTGFDAKEAIKLSATVQVCFRLEKPVSELISHITNLEYDIYGEIGVPDTKVVVLSMHKSGAYNWTDVVIGVLSDPMNAVINPVSLSVLRSSLIELFLRQSNLTLTTSTFGNASTLEILKVPGGVTIIPQSASIWQIPQILFNFTLNNSISEILDNFIDFKNQLTYGLHLWSYETVYVQITNLNGSTVSPPVIVQASIMSDYGIILPQRLKQLAETITGSPDDNLGLNNSLFGKVNSISLSSLLKDTLSSTPTPSPAPAPSPELSDYTRQSISPYHSPSYSPATSPAPHPVPCHNCEVSSPAPSIVTKNPPYPCPNHGFIHPPAPSPFSFPKPTIPPADIPPGHAPSSFSSSSTLDPSPAASPRPGQGKKIAKNVVSPSLAPSPSSLAVVHYHGEIRVLGFCATLIFYLLCWSS